MTRLGLSAALLGLGLCGELALGAARTASAAVSASLASGGTVLRVEGDAASNVVDVVLDDDGDEIVVESGGLAIFSSSSFSVERIVIRLFGGDDVLFFGVAPGTDFLFDKAVTIDLGSGGDDALIEFRDGLSGDVLVRGKLDISLKGGDGDDTVYAHFGRKHSSSLELDASMGAGNDECRGNLWGDVSGGADVDIDLRGGSGDDTLGTYSVYETQGQVYDSIDVTGDSTVSIRLRGNAGNDVFQAATSGEVDGDLELRIEGSSGTDDATVTSHLRAGSTGSYVARALAGGNDDTFTLNVYDVSGGTFGAPDAVLNGGGGADACTSTPNVVEAACES